MFIYHCSIASPYVLLWFPFPTRHGRWFVLAFWHALLWAAWNWIWTCDVNSPSLKTPCQPHFKTCHPFEYCFYENTEGYMKAEAFPWFVVAGHRTQECDIHSHTHTYIYIYIYYCHTVIHRNKNVGVTRMLVSHIPSWQPTNILLQHESFIFLCSTGIYLE